MPLSAVAIAALVVVGFGQSAPSAKSPDVSDASGRVEIVTVKGPLYLAHPGEIDLRIQGVSLPTLYLIQRSIPPPGREFG